MLSLRIVNGEMADSRQQSKSQISHFILTLQYITSVTTPLDHRKAEDTLEYFNPCPSCLSLSAVWSRKSIMKSFNVVMKPALII